MGEPLATTIEDSVSVLGGLNALVGILLGLIALATAFGSWYRWLRPRWKERRARQEAFEHAILGRPAVPHPEIPGRILSPAIPGVAERQARQEEQMKSLVESVSKIADTHVRLDALDERVGRLESHAGMERLVRGMESTQMLRTIETVAQAPPPDTGE